MNKSHEKARLESLYKETVIAKLQSDLKLKNIMEVPKISKIVLNIGVKEAVGDSKILQSVQKTLSLIAGQAPVITRAKDSIAGFKIRKDMPLGVKVTLRKQRMYEFLDRLINLSLPMVRDFRGVKANFDKAGNYNLGIKEWVVFPEVDYDMTGKVFGMNITIVMSSKNKQHSYALLKNFGMPFVQETK
ncbi:50S ribosomal protein L5 [Candidatus Dependentiae bacterium]|nr:50S ribosomal protein L5 [Candidatus Dependentiae bacterium]